MKKQKVILGEPEGLLSDLPLVSPLAVPDNDNRSIDDPLGILKSQTLGSDQPHEVESR